MARSLEFNRTKAVESAMKLFWARGYTATSLPELLQAMGIARSSFYATFHTKEDLFIECLELFGERTLAIVKSDAETIPAEALPRAFFEKTLLDVSQRVAKQGCMLVNTILELADVAPQLGQLAASKLSDIESAFAQAFQEANTPRELDTAWKPGELAAMVMTLNYGIRVQSRKVHSREALRPLLANSLTALGLAA